MTDNLNKMTPLQFFKHLQHWIWLFPLRDPDVHLFTGNTTDNVFKCHICGKHITREEMHKHYDMEAE